MLVTIFTIFVQNVFKLNTYFVPMYVECRRRRRRPHKVYILVNINTINNNQKALLTRFKGRNKRVKM